MRTPQLQVTYRRGKAEIAYLCLSRQHGEKAHQSERVDRRWSWISIKLER